MSEQSYIEGPCTPSKITSHAVVRSLLEASRDAVPRIRESGESGSERVEGADDLALAIRLGQKHATSRQLVNHVWVVG